MTVLIERKGNLFDSNADAYAHGVNTVGLMGAGIAVGFKRAYPDMYQAYKILCKNGNLLPGSAMEWLDRDRVIYNIASQDKPGKNARLEWFESGLHAAINMADKRNTCVIAMPRIGCGIGGLAWDDVRDIIDYYATITKVDLEVWSL